MYVHHDARLIYLAHPRTASVATSEALRKAGFQKLNPPWDHHGRLWAEGTPVTEENRKEWYVFTAVRNHYDAVVSWGFRKFRTSNAEKWTPIWLEKITGEGNRWVRSDRLWWLHSDDADCIIRYEDLEPQINSVLSMHGLHTISIPRRNVSENRGNRHYRDILNDECREYIKGRFRHEIERFGYEF